MNFTIKRVGKMIKLTPKIIEEIINIWERETDTDQHRDCADEKDLQEVYKKIAIKIEELKND